MSMIFKISTVFSFPNSYTTYIAGSFLLFGFRCQRPRGTLCRRTPPLGPQSLHHYIPLVWHISADVTPAGSTRHDKGSCKTLTRHRGTRAGRTPRLSSQKPEPTARGRPWGGFLAPWQRVRWARSPAAGWQWARERPNEITGIQLGEGSALILSNSFLIGLKSNSFYNVSPGAHPALGCRWMTQSDSPDVVSPVLLHSLEWLKMLTCVSPAACLLLMRQRYGHLPSLLQPPNANDV